MFIKLTGYSNDLAIYIRPDVIIAIAGQSSGGTHVQINSLEGGFAVKEPPEQIMEMIKNA